MTYTLDGAGEGESPVVHGAEPWTPWARGLMLATSDLLALLLAGTLAYNLWAAPVRGQEVELYAQLAPLTLIFIGSYAQAGLYPGFGLGPVQLLRRYWLATTAVFVALAALTFALKLPPQYSRMTIGLSFLLSLGLVPLFRKTTNRFARRLRWWPEPVLYLGEVDRLETIRELLSGHGNEFRVVGTAAPESLVAPGDGSNRGAPGRARPAVQIALLDRPPADELELDRLRTIFRRLLVLSDIRHLPIAGVQIRNLGDVLALEYQNNLLRARNRWLKRAVDLLIAVPAFLVALPITVAAIAAVRIRSRGPGLYRQEREGRYGRPIEVPKIRTMTPGAEHSIDEIVDGDPSLREQWEAGFKLTDDPRVVPGVGRFLRRFSIDELPQLWSVIRGDMSLVGPRPFPAYHLEKLSPHARHLRRQVRPGLTGLWQIEARGSAGIEEQQDYDVFYIRNWSLWLDLYILAHTARVVLSGDGAY